MKIFQKEKIGQRCYIYLFGYKVLSYKKNKYDNTYLKRFCRLTLREKRIILEKQFYERLNYKLCFNNPQTFNEKIQWLKLYYHHPLMTICADKVKVREYIKKKIGAKYLIPCIGVYDSPEAINFDKLPNQFVLKVNWGSGQNIIVRDKSKLEIKDVIKQLRQWMRKESNHYYHFLEWSYKNIEPKIIIEKYIRQKDQKLLDWKFHCFNGKALYVQIDVDRDTSHSRCFYDMNFKKQPFTTQYPFFKDEIEKPNNFAEMKKIAERLANKFPYVRVDLYNLDRGGGD